MALSTNTPRTFCTDGVADFAVAASSTIYEGSLLGLASGYVRALQAGDVFVGVSTEYIDNSAGSAGDKRVHAYTTRPFEMALSGVAVTDIGAPVYASDDGTLTLTEGSNSLVGYVENVETGGTAIVMPVKHIGAIYTDLNTP